MVELHAWRSRTGIIPGRTFRTRDNRHAQRVNTLQPNTAMPRSPSFRSAACAGFIVFVCGALHSLAADGPQTRNIFLITTDGMRPQEIFNGAEEALLVKENCDGSDRKVAALRHDFYPAKSTTEERRRLLMPFLAEFAEKGQLFGNRAKGGDVHVTNTRHFSYPGYSEILTGIADPRIDSNDKVYNPNVTVLDWLNRRPAFAGKVAAFGSWDLFPFIINQPRAGIPVHAGWDIVDGNDPKHAEILPMLRNLFRQWDGVTYDAITFHFAMDYIRENQPRVFYLSFGETDDWAHGRRYDLHLRSAHNFDSYLRQLWDYVQSTPGYKDNTTFVISTDHGRGTGPDLWKDHGSTNPGSNYIWLAVRGPDTAPKGDRDNRTVTQNQIAATVAAFLGEDYHGAFPLTGAAIPDVLPAGQAAKP
jgi:hypothetical protein